MPLGHMGRFPAIPGPSGKQGLGFLRVSQGFPRPVQPPPLLKQVDSIPCADTSASLFEPSALVGSIRDILAELGRECNTRLDADDTKVG